MTEPETQTPPRRRRFSAEMITAVSAVFIGLCAIVVSVYETFLIRQQLKGAAWPHLSAGFSYNEQGFRYLISNDGVGPARIDHMLVLVDGEPVANWAELFRRLDFEVGNYVSSWIAGRVIGPTVVVEPLVLSGREDIDRFYGLQSRISMELCYCSVHDDCWVVSGAAPKREVRRCETTVEPRFLN